MRIGIIGCGYIAQTVYLPILASATDVELVGTLAIDKEQAEYVAQKWKIGFSTDRMDALLEKKLDAAFVLTPPGAHYENTKALLSAGIDVFTEKPLAAESEKAAELAVLAGKNKRVLMVGFNRRFALLYRQAKEMFEAKIVRLALFEKHRAKAAHHGIYTNFLIDSIHQVDLLRFYCGEATVEKAAVDMSTGNMAAGVGVARLASGGLGVIQTCLQASGWTERATLHGDQLSVEVNAFRSLIARHPDRQVVYGDDRPGRWVPDLVERGFQGEVDHFFECVKTRAQPETNGDESVKTQKLMEQIVSGMGGELRMSEINSAPYEPWKK